MFFLCPFESKSTWSSFLLIKDFYKKCSTDFDAIFCHDTAWPKNLYSVFCLTRGFITVMHQRDSRGPFGWHHSSVTAG